MREDRPIANRNFLTQSLLQLDAKTVLLSCSFTVDQNNRFGVTGLVGAGVDSVFMYNDEAEDGDIVPVRGVIVVKLQDTYPRCLGAWGVLQENNSGADGDSVTTGDPYIIADLGTATLAEWQTAGLPVGITPQVGTVFIGAVDDVIGGDALVSSPLNPNVLAIDMVGNPSFSNALSPANPTVRGMYLTFACRNGTGEITAPEQDTVITIFMYLSNSSVTLQGQ